MAQGEESGIKDDEPLVFGCTRPIGTYDVDLVGSSDPIYQYLITSPTLPPPQGAVMTASYYTETWQPVAGSSPLVYKKGPCYGIRSIYDPGTSDSNPEDVILPLPADPVFDPAPPPSGNGCPEESQIEIDFFGNVTFNGNTLSEGCCNDSIVGYPVNFITAGGVSKCMLVETGCLPPEQLTIFDNVVIGITSESCCTPLITNINNVFWNQNTEQCEISQSVEIVSCPFSSFVSLINGSSDGTNIEQIFGIDESGHQTSIARPCCNEEIVGFPVEWDSNLNICKKPINPLPVTQPSITLNENMLVLNQCQDLLVSTKLYFSEPLEECNLNGITASLLISNDNLTVTQLGIFDSVTDGFNNWVDLGIRISNFFSGDTFDLKLTLVGLSDCCEYDIRVDNIRVDCYKDEDRIFYDNKKCPGFDLRRVIDNKKSWVYNVGEVNIGKSEDDNIIRSRGDVSLLENFGFVNRKFAPSLDADIPWRYTDYYEQSNILEPHSKAVINSKEMELTFNMCGTCCYEYQPCPNGYTLSAGTDTCYKYVVSKQFQDDEEFQFQDGEWYDFMDFENP